MATTRRRNAASRGAAVVGAIAAAALFGQTAIAPEVQRALNSITAANLRGDLSFLASDTLQGRYTPSPGLDVAAEFIASEFRAAGLDPAGNADYFQTAEMIDRHTGSKSRLIEANENKDAPEPLAPEDRKVTLKNVIGILRGSDPHLRDTFVLLTAHYDHLGTTETAGRMANPHAKQNSSDHIYNGANDDGSGTVSVIEIAKALARLHRHPKRSIVFMTFFGEERGEIGSHYYSEHPIFPLAKTVANINLEQVGRTDSTVGKQINTASVTGYDYSEVTKFLERAGRETGIRVYLDKSASDPYFRRSDNAALAQKGVPAHTLTVAFDFPDYHGVGDEWEKIDYENMARVDRMLALAMMDIANSVRAPQWNAENPKTAPFREAQRKLEGR